MEGGKLGVSVLEVVVGVSPVAPGRKRFLSPLLLGETSMLPG